MTFVIAVTAALLTSLRNPSLTTSYHHCGFDGRAGLTQSASNLCRDHPHIVSLLSEP